jgi:hypothetical protein
MPTQFKSLKTNICTVCLQVSQMPLHMFRLQQAIFRRSKFYICSTSVSSFISTSHINTKQILNSQLISTQPTSAVQTYKIQGMSCVYLSWYILVYKRLKVSLKLHIYWLGEACSTYGGEDRCIQDFGGET